MRVVRVRHRKLSKVFQKIHEQVKEDVRIRRRFLPVIVSPRITKTKDQFNDNDALVQERKGFSARKLLHVTRPRRKTTSQDNFEVQSQRRTTSSMIMTHSFKKEKDFPHGNCCTSQDNVESLKFEVKDCESFNRDIFTTCYCFWFIPSNEKTTRWRLSQYFKIYSWKNMSRLNWRRCKWDNSTVNALTQSIYILQQVIGVDPFQAMTVYLEISSRVKDYCKGMLQRIFNHFTVIWEKWRTCSRNLGFW